MKLKMYCINIKVMVYIQQNLKCICRKLKCTTNYYLKNIYYIQIYFILKNLKKY